MKIVLTLLLLATLSACGVDGAPKPPAAAVSVAPVSITGDLRMGVTNQP